jgi:hypothetical protein
LSRISVPDSARFVARGRNDLISLWIELDFGYFIIVALKKSSTSSSENIIDSRQSVS